MNVLNYITQETRNSIYQFNDAEIDKAFLEHETYLPKIIDDAKTSELYFRYRGSWDFIIGTHSKLMNMVWIPYLDTLVSRKLLLKYQSQYFHISKLPQVIEYYKSVIRKLQNDVRKLKKLEYEMH